MTLWQICLAIFLILFGLLHISTFTFTGAGVVLSLLAIATGVFLFAKK
jgi:hypothetical protein